MKGNSIVAQSGGPTAVINASACGVIQEALRNPDIECVYAAHNGILGVLSEEIFDMGKEDPGQREANGRVIHLKSREDFEYVDEVGQERQRHADYNGG